MKKKSTTADTSKKKTITKKLVAKKNLKTNIPSTIKFEKKTKSKLGLGMLVIVNDIVFVAVLIINYLAVSLPIGGITTGALSDLYPNLFVPAALTFSIWGLIYFLLLGFVIWQAIDFYKKQSTGITKKVGIWFLFSCIANIGRMFAWQYQQVALSVIIMILFLFVLIVLAKKIEIGKKIGSIGDKYLVQVPFSIYLGRICVATIANVTALLVHIGWGMRGMSDIFWTVCVIIVATILALRSLYKNNNIMLAGVIIWAFIGIIIKRIDVDPVYAKHIIWTLGIGIAIITAGIGAKFESWKKN